MPDPIPVRNKPRNCILCGEPVTGKSDIRSLIGDWHKKCDAQIQSELDDGSLGY